MKYDIITPHWGQYADVEVKAIAFVESVVRHSHDYRLIWIENGAPPTRQLRQALDTVPDLLYVRSSENIGFIRATNIGLQLSTAPYVVLMNNDTEAVPDWLDKLASPLQGAIGISGPLTTTRDSWQGRQRPKDDTVRILPKGSMLAFFCTMFRREVIQQVGYLDTDFGMGLGDDDMYCMLAQEAGWQLALVQNLTIPHHHRSSFLKLMTPEQVKVAQQAARELFAGKKRERIRS